MKGDERVITKLNDLLADELTAINQYTVHAEMCKNWGYEKLHEYIEHCAIKEMHHVSELIQRILFLGGAPVVTTLKEINIGSTVDKQLVNDWQAERDAVKSYNDGIILFFGIGDSGSRELIEHFLVDEEEHIDWLEAQIDQIDQMGIENYLSTKA